MLHTQCTVTINDGLDLLAEFMGVKEQVEALTNQVSVCGKCFGWAAGFAGRIMSFFCLLIHACMVSRWRLKAIICKADNTYVLLAQAMDGSMNMETSLDERLKVINCKPDDVRRFIKANPPQQRLTPVRGFHCLSIIGPTHSTPQLYFLVRGSLQV